MLLFTYVRMLFITEDTVRDVRAIYFWHYPIAALSLSHFIFLHISPYSTRILSNKSSCAFVFFLSLFRFHTQTIGICQNDRIASVQLFLLNMHSTMRVHLYMWAVNVTHMRHTICPTRTPFSSIHSFDLESYVRSVAHSVLYTKRTDIRILDSVASKTFVHNFIVILSCSIIYMFLACYRWPNSGKYFIN